MIILNQWTSYFINDPDDDYNLVVEILCDDRDVAVIHQRKQGLLLKWYTNPKGLIIPVDWLSSLLLRAKEGLIEPNPSIDEIITNQWTAGFANDSDSDYLTVKILCDEKIVAVIKQAKQSLILEWYDSPKGLVIPVDWLSSLLLKVKEGFVDFKN